MDIIDVEKGMNVRISKNISLTKSRHSACSEMFRMRGKIFKVDTVNMTRNNVRIQGYVWAPEDLSIPPGKKINAKVFHYDVNHLEMEC